MKMNQQLLTDKAIDLLKELISIQSFSGEEHHTAEAIENWFKSFDIPFQRENNNIFAKNKHWDSTKPTLLLNSHHDTVRPNKAYTRDPFDPQIENGKLFGLGSNDAGGALVSLCHLRPPAPDAFAARPRVGAAGACAHPGRSEALR